MAIPKHKDDEKVLEFNKYNLGINLSKSDRQLLPGELLTATNFKYNDFGELETRQGLTLVTASALPAGSTIQHAAKVTIGTTTYEMLVGSDHKIWYLNGSDVPTSIGTNQTAEGDVQILQFGNYAVILDGSYIKYWDGGAAGLKLAYDLGSGTDSYMYDNWGTSNTTVGGRNLESTATIKCGQKFTTAAWTSAAIPINTISMEVSLKKVGSPTGNITCTIYNSTGASLLYTSDTALDSSTLTTDYATYTFDFTGVSILPNTTYLWCVQYSGGDISNYVYVEDELTTVTDGYYWLAGDVAWRTNGPRYSRLKIAPAVPPKVTFGRVHSGRLYAAGDPSYPAYLRYSNANTIFDWSTENGGGYIGVSGDDAGNFPIGGILSHYYDLYLVGKQERPFIAKLTGTQPSDYAIAPLFQQCWTDHKCLISAVNDFWFGSGDGVHAMSGVTEYGDLRSFSEGDPVLAKVKTYFSTASFAGYNPVDGQFLLKMSGYSNILVCHTKHPQSDENGRKRYPWTEYLFAGLTPTTFATWDDTLYVGCSNGNLYSLTNDVNDVSTQPTYTLKSGWIEFPMISLFMRRLAHEIDSDAAATYRMSFYTNGDDTAAIAYVDKTLTDSPMGNKLAFKASSIQWLINTLVITKPLRIKGFSLKALPLKWSPVAPVNYTTPTSYSIADASVYSVTTSISANYDIADDGTHDRYIYFLNGGSTDRLIVPTGTYRTGMEVIVYNTGSAVLTFNSTGLNFDILPGTPFSPATFRYDGTQWR